MTKLDDYREDSTYAKAQRESKLKRMLHELELHTTMKLGESPIGVFRVVGGWIYYDSEDRWACFVPKEK